MSTQKQLTEVSDMKASLPAATRRGELYPAGKVDGRFLDPHHLARMLDLSKRERVSETLSAGERLELKLFRRLATVGGGPGYMPDDLNADEELEFAGFEQTIAEWRAFWSDRWS